MKKTFSKSTPEQIAEMKKLWQKGISCHEIARRMKKDRSTIAWHCGLNKRKFIIRTKRAIEIKPPAEPSEYDRFNERPREGKNYKEYVSESRGR